MIDQDGFLRCDGCGTKFGQLVDDGLVIVCPKSRCKRYNLFQGVKKAVGYMSHKLLDLTTK